MLIQCQVSRSFAIWSHYPINGVGGVVCHVSVLHSLKTFTIVVYSVCIYKYALLLFNDRNDEIVNKNKNRSARSGRGTGIYKTYKNHP